MSRHYLIPACHCVFDSTCPWMLCHCMHLGTAFELIATGVLEGIEEPVVSWMCQIKPAQRVVQVFPAEDCLSSCRRIPIYGQQSGAVLGGQQCWAFSRLQSSMVSQRYFLESSPEVACPLHLRIGSSISWGPSPSQRTFLVFVFHRTVDSLGGKWPSLMHHSEILITYPWWQSCPSAVILARHTWRNYFWISCNSGTKCLEPPAGTMRNCVCNSMNWLLLHSKTCFSAAY